jgi:hypothetical protein
MTDELSNTNQLKADEMTVDTDASHTTQRHLTAVFAVDMRARLQVRPTASIMQACRTC